MISLHINRWCQWQRAYINWVSENMMNLRVDRWCQRRRACIDWVNEDIMNLHVDRWYQWWKTCINWVNESFMKVEFVLRWKNKCELSLEFLFHEISYNHVLKEYVNVVYISMKTFFIICILSYIIERLIVYYINLIYYRFWLLSDWFWL